MIYEAREGVITMKIICPHCRFSARWSVSYIEDAIHDGIQLMCITCSEIFTIETVCQPRADELRNEAVDAGADDHTKELSTED